MNAATYTAAEDAGTAAITITRSGGSTGIVEATLSIIAGGTALANQDYTAIASTVRFADGETAPRSVTVVILDDSSDEPDETVLLSLTTPTGGATLGAQTTATLTITDNDLPPPSFTVGGTVTGLVSGGLVLQNNGGNDLPIATDGAFVFTLPLTGGSYGVTISAQPTNQSCTIDHASGVIAGNVTDVTVHCFALQSVVFTRKAGGVQNDLYLIHEDGTGLVALATTVDADRFKALTPSGKIIFDRNADGTNLYDLYAVNQDGSGTTSLGTSSVYSHLFGAVTPNGKIIYRHSSPGNGLYVVDVDGTNRLTLDAGNVDVVCGVTAQGKVIYSTFEPTQADRYVIYSINEDGSGKARLTPANTGEQEFCLRLSSQGTLVFGRYLVNGGPADLFAVNADGSGLATLSDAPGEDIFGSFIGSDRVLYASLPVGSNSAGTYYSVKLDGTQKATLTTGPDSESIFFVTPAGRAIVVRYVPIAGTTRSQADIYSINADGTGLAPLATTTDSEYPVGKVTAAGQIVYEVSTAAGTQLFAVNPDGTGKLPLTDLVQDQLRFAEATPDGRVIYFLSSPTQPGLFDAFSVRSDGSDRTTLLSGVNENFYVGMTQSSRVIFLRYGPGLYNQDLYSIKLDGSGLQTLADATDEETVVQIF